MASLKIFLLIFSALLSICLASITPVCDPQRMADLGLNVDNLKFCDKSLPFEVRAKDLVDRMIVEEKVKQLGSTSAGVERLGLPPYEWWSEALHGVSDVGPGTVFNKDVPSATSFPTPITLAACFNRGLWKNMGEVVSTEARAMRNVGISGLTFWSPTMNVVRDPRWGRIMETPGEDPFLVGEYVVSYVRGLQDIVYEDVSRSASRPLKVAACCKHYTAYDLDSWLGIDRTHFDAKVAERDLIETFNRPFEKCVKEGDVSSVMCSFNNMNGLPTCADTKLLSDTIRGEWNLNGYIVSDCDSIEVIVDSQRFLDDTPEDAVRQVLRAGLDLDCGVYYTNYTLSAMKQGKVRESDVDKALKNLYVVLMRLGFFDGSSFDDLGKEDICNGEHIELAREAARQGIVLLKNTNNTLPLDASKLRSVAAVGPHAEATTAMIGNYAGVPCGYKQPKDAYANYTRVHFMRGCNGVKCPSPDWIANAVKTSKISDATIIHVGLDISIEAEWLDRTSLFLPGYQTQLVNEIIDAAPAEHPVILVIFSGGPVDVSFAQNNSKVGAILWAGYPGEQGGNALADIIFGKYSPGGRLPLTWYYNDYVNQIPMTSMMLRPDNVLVYPGRTYKFYEGPLLYPFGYGLSYTEFEYTLLSSTSSLDVKLSPLQHCYPMRNSAGDVPPPCPAVLVKDTPCTETIDFEVEVKNVGKKSGSNVVTAYSIAPGGIDIGGTPLKQLVGFERVFVEVGSSKTVKFSINACSALSLVTDTAYTVLPFGKSNITIEGGNGDKVSFPVKVEFSY